MSDTTYVDYVAPAVNAEWLNEVNDHVWHDTPVVGTDVHSATVIKVTPFSDIISTNVQSALTEINNKLSTPVAIDASIVTYTPIGTDAVPTTVDKVLQERVCVYDFMSATEIADAKARTLTLDLTSSMQKAHDTGKLIYYPSGDYLHNPTITMSSGGICGDGPLLTNLKTNDTGSSNLFKFTGALGSYSNIPVFRDFTIQVLGSKTDGAGIQFLPATGETSYIDIRNVHFVGCPIGIDFVAASLWKVIGCDFLSYTVAGIQSSNTNTPDSGDSVISDCVFNTPNTTGRGILFKSSGGLKIVGNKFLGGLNGFAMSLTGSTSVLIIAGNSIENMAGPGISFSRITGATLFKNVSITGNEFSVGAVAINTDATGFLSQVVISGNIINMGATGSNPCIALNSVTDFFIGDNTIRGNGGAGSSAVNITSCTNGKIGLNTYANLPTPIVITTSPTVTYQLDKQSGSSVTPTTGYIGYGSCFISSSVSVTFPRAFLMTPAITDLTIQPGSSNGALGGFVTAISKTGFSYNAITSVTGIAATVYWKCNGVL